MGLQANLGTGSARATAVLLSLALSALPALSALTAGAAAAQTNGPGPAACLNLTGILTPPAPVWPTVPEELRGDKIRRGSALARLVLANQDFSLLSPAEAQDGKPIPLWLRVNWKKAHPQTLYRASDPTGGYPPLLLELYRWMLEHQDLTAGPPPPDAAPEPAGRQASRSGEERISGAQTVPVHDSDVRVNPAAPDQILAAATEPTGMFGRVQIFYSTDGGASWGRSSLPLAADEFQSEGAVEWTPDGTAWATAVAVTPINEHWSYSQLRAYRSTDQGRTWTFDALLSGNQSAAHRERLWVDDSPTSPYQGDLYAIWNDLDGVWFARRTHGDGAWHRPIQVSDAQTAGSFAGAEAATDSSGALFGFWADGRGGKIFAARSTDGGVSFGTPVPIATLFGDGTVGTPATAGTAAPTRVSGTAFRNGAGTQVYAVWIDLSGEAGCKRWTEQPSFFFGATACKSRVWFARSTDGGDTWSPPVKVSDRAVRDDQFLPELAVDPASGKLHLTYYDTFGDPGRALTNLVYQSSVDGGTTWSDPFPVTTAATDETGIYADSSHYGSQNGLSVGGSRIFATWTDRRNGAREEIWGATLTDPDPCSAPAVTGLQATPQPAGTALAWDAVPGATYRVLRAPAAGGPYSLLAATTLPNYFDPEGDCAVTRRYAVRAVTGCVSLPSAEVTATGRPASVLYSNGFESGSGLADWRAASLPGFASAADWRGIETCPAHGGSDLFRFGGATCLGSAVAGDFAFAYPQGPNGIPIPPGATGVQLSFWHRRDFQPGSGGFVGISLSDLVDGCLAIPADALSGESYNAVFHSNCVPQPLLFKSYFTGASSTFQQTVVDLDRAFTDTFAIAGSVAGHVVEPLFFGYTDCGAGPQAGWFLDDVTVTACTAPPAPAYGFYTLPPCRLLDTRQPAGPDGGPRLGASAARDLAFAGRCAIPLTAKALSVNITVVQPAMPGSLVLYPDDQDLPLATTINFAAGAVRTNNAILGLGNGTGGAIAQNLSLGGVDLVIDVNGYFQ